MGAGEGGGLGEGGSTPLGGGPGQEERDDCLSGDAFTAPGEAETLGGGGFDGDALGGNAEEGGEAHLHGERMRGDFWPFTDQRHISVGENAGAGGNAAGCMGEEAG